jgi:hypothetical protein
MEGAFFIKNFLPLFFHLIFSFVSYNANCTKEKFPWRPCPRSFLSADVIRGQAKRRNTAHTIWKKEVRMCMKKRTVVLLVVSLIAIYGMMHMMPLLFGRPLLVFNMDMPRHYGPFAGHPHFAFQGPQDHMMMFNGWMMFRIFPFLFHLTLLLSGWIWWKRKSPLQWLGLAFHL